MATNNVTTTMSKEKRYYLKNKDSINEKRREKAAQDKLEKDIKWSEDLQTIKDKIKKINASGESIYNSIISPTNKKYVESVVDMLKEKILPQYDLGGMTNLEILADYMALNSIPFNTRSHPWNIIRDNIHPNFGMHIKNRKTYYGKLTIQNSRVIKSKSLECDEKMYTYMCKLI